MQGIVPRFCEEIYQTIEHRKGDGSEIEVTFSMLEIYNEIVKDLLNVNNDNKNKNKKKGLKVREHPTKGFYGKNQINVCLLYNTTNRLNINYFSLNIKPLAEGLKSFLVTNYKEIEEKINEGTTNRSIAATNMNETSSRAHTIIIINLKQKSKNASGQETTKASTINLVDLAGRYATDPTVLPIES